MNSSELQDLADQAFDAIRKHTGESYPHSTLTEASQSFNAIVQDPIRGLGWLIDNTAGTGMTHLGLTQWLVEANELMLRDHAPATEFPEGWEVDSQEVVQFVIKAPMDQSGEVLDWIYKRGGSTTRSGPAVKKFPQMDMTRCEIHGWVPLHPRVEGS